MARRGVLISLILTFLLLAGGVLVYWTLPFWLSRAIGGSLRYSGYRFRPLWSLHFDRIEADSLFAATNVTVQFTFLQFLFDRRIRSFAAESLVLFTKHSSARVSTWKPPTEPRFGFALFPFWVERIEVGTGIFNQGAREIVLRGIRSQFITGMGFWRWKGSVQAVEWEGMPRHQISWSGFVHPDALYLQRLEVHGPRITAVGELIGAEGRLLTHWDTLAFGSYGTALQARVLWNYRKKTGMLEAKNITIQGQTYSDVYTRIRWIPDSLQVEDLSFTFHNLQIQGSGWLSPRDRLYHGLLEARGRWGDWSFAPLRFRFSGGPSQVGGHLWIPQGGFRTQEIQNLEADIQLRWEGDRWRVESLRAQKPILSGSFVRQGSQWKGLLEAREVKASIWHPEALGKIDLRLGLEGHGDTTLVRGTVSGASLRFSDLTLRDFQFDVQGLWRSLRVKGQAQGVSLLNQKFQQVHADFQRSDGSWTFHIQGQSYLGPEVSMAGAWKISPRGTWMRGDTLRLVHPQTGTTFLGTFSLSQEKGRWFFVGEGRDNTGGRLQILASLDSLLAVSVQVESLNLRALPVPSSVKGKVDLHLKIHGDPSTPELVLQGQWRGYALAGLQVDTVEFSARYSQDTLTISELRAVGPDREARAEGWIQASMEDLQNRDLLRQAPISLHLVTWKWPATSWLNQISNDLYFEKATLTLDVTLQGTFYQPRLEGRVIQEAGTMVLIPGGSVVKNWRLEGEAQGKAFEIAQIHGTTDGGAIQGNGRVTFRGLNADSVYLNLRFKKFPLKPAPEIDVEVAGLIRVSGEFPRLYVDGDLTIVQGYLSLPFGKSRVPSQPESPSPIRYRITLKSPGRLYFINDVVQAELKTDLVVTKDQDVGRSISGSLEVLNGTFLYLDRAFTITEGRMVFNQNLVLNPEIQFHAENLVQDSILVTLVATGTLQSPEVNLTSDPPLSLEDIIALLSFGRTLAQLTPSLKSMTYIRERSLNLAEALISRELKQRLRLTELEIATGLTGRDPHFTVGFYLSPRVHIRYTHDILSPTKDIFLLNYTLTSRVGLYIERDRDGQLGGGLNFRVRF